MLLATQTGLRLSELTGLVRSDIHLGPGAYVHVVGKGRKERCTPLTSQTAEVLRTWLAELPACETQVVFPSRRGARMSNDGIQYLLARHVETARKSCVPLRNKRVSPHVLRHAAAMNLLQAGVDTTVIAMWLRIRSRICFSCSIATELVPCAALFARLLIAIHRAPPRSSSCCASPIAAHRCRSTSDAIRKLRVSKFAHTIWRPTMNSPNDTTKIPSQNPNLREQLERIGLTAVAA